MRDLESSSHWPAGEVSAGAPGVPSIDVRGTLRRNRWMVATLFVVIFGTSVVGTMLMPRKYDSTFKVLVKKERADVMVTPERTIGLSERGDVEEAAIYSEVELLSSADILWPAAELSLDAKRRTKVQNWLEKTGWFEAGLSRDKPRKETDTEEEFRRIRKNLEITPVRKSNVIQVRYTDESPEQANMVLRLIAQRYLDAHVKLHGTVGTYEAFKSEAETYLEELLRAEERLSDFLRSRNITDLTEEKNLHLIKMLGWEASARDVEASVQDYEKRVVELRSRLARVPVRVLTESRTKPNLYLVDGLYRTLINLRNRRSELLTKYRPEDRAVQAVDQQIADTEATIDEVKDVMPLEKVTDLNPRRQNLETELSAAVVLFRGLEARYERVRGYMRSHAERLAELQEATREHEKLGREQKEAEENYLLYAKKAEEARIAESLDRRKIANVAIAEGPTLEKLPSKPNFGLNFAVGFLVATLVSFGSPFVVERLRETVHAPEELELTTGLRALASVPSGQQWNPSARSLD